MLASHQKCKRTRTDNIPHTWFEFWYNCRLTIFSKRRHGNDRLTKTIITQCRTTQEVDLSSNTCKATPGLWQLIHHSINCIQRCIRYANGLAAQLRYHLTHGKMCTMFHNKTCARARPPAGWARQGQGGSKKLRWPNGQGQAGPKVQRAGPGINILVYNTIDYIINKSSFFMVKPTASIKPRVQSANGG